LAVSKDVEHPTTIQPSHSTFRYFPRGNENIHPNKDLQTGVHIRFVCNSLMLEHSQLKI
jgi:hypothetical protein